MKDSKPPIVKLIKQLTRRHERKHLKALFAEQRRAEGLGIDWYGYRSKNGKDLAVLNHFLPGYLEQISGTTRYLLSYLALVLIRTRESLAIEDRARTIFRVLKRRYEESHSTGMSVGEILRRTGFAEGQTLEALSFLQKSGLSLGAVGGGRLDTASIMMPSERILEFKTYDDVRRDAIRWEIMRRTPGQPVSSTTLFESASGKLLSEGWVKVRNKLPSDPAGAITGARSALESELKGILDALGAPHGNEKLPALYRLVVNQLSLAPDKRANDAIKQILGGCASVVQGLAALRNRMSDAHGHGRLSVTPAIRHAELAVNCAEAIAMFLLAAKDAASGP
jgi:hypothetical protein